MKNKKMQEKINKHKFNAKYVKIVKQKNICDLIYLGHKPINSVKRIKGNKYIKYKKVWKHVHCGTEISEIGATPWKKDIFKYQEIIETDGKEYEYMSRTGERNVRSLRKIFNDMRYLINTNFTPDEADKQLFITLTYKENMQDEKRLYDDFRKFMMRLKDSYKNEHDFGYIVIIEPQARGAWHCHLLLKTMNQPKLTIPWCHLVRTWGHGMITIERLKSDNLGSYFVAYMSNAEVDPDTISKMQISDEDIKTKDGKRYVKGERLKFYPDYMKIYRNSKNMIKPQQLKAAGYNELVEIAEEQFPDITYQTIREIETKNKPLIIVKEQRRIITPL